MTNKEAILAMINGKKVKKDTWHNGIYMFFDGDCFRDNDGNAHTYFLSISNWEIYEEPKLKQVVVIEKWLIFDKLTKSYLIAEESNIEEFLKDDMAYLSKVKLIDTYTYEVEL